MSGEDQERFEDYLELEHYIDTLQAGQVAHPPTELTPDQARIYRMAALFRAASPEGDEPRPEFAAELKARLEQELQDPPKPALFPFLKKREKKPRHISRRALLTGGAAIAASLAVGVGIGRTVEQVVDSSIGQGAPASSQYPDTLPGDTWHQVISLASLGDSAVHFATDTVVGYVVRDDGDDGDPNKGQIIAMSAACTHQGCIVQWQDSDRKFHCPCHGGLFSEYGQVDRTSGPIRYLTPLPRLETKIEHGYVYVKVPVKK